LEGRGSKKFRERERDQLFAIKLLKKRGFLCTSKLSTMGG